MGKIILYDDGYTCLDKLFAQIQRNNMIATEQMKFSKYIKPLMHGLFQTL